MALTLGIVFLLSIGVIVYTLWSLLVGGDELVLPPIPTRAALSIPAGAVQFNSIEEFERGFRGRGTAPFALVVRNADITTRIAAETQKNPGLPFRVAQTEIQDDRITLIGQLRVPGGFDAPARVVIEPRAVSGRIQYDIPEIDFGPIPAPGPARNIIADTVDRSLSDLRISETMFVEGLEARGGALTIVGRLR
ncbi:MAG: hypothetical protein FJ033_11850 [Chloroflexi bacterium]|nr:hypothetical protein [Chloroflexota bacterium]